MSTRERCESRAVISGIGQSDIGRQVERSALQLTLDAIISAVADAGLSLSHVDGLAMYPGGGATNVPGYAGPPLDLVHDALALATTWRQGINEGLGLPFLAAVHAVAAGSARHVVVYRTVKEGSAARRGGGRPAYGSTKPVASGAMEWWLPVGALSPVCHVAAAANRYLHEAGVAREDLGWIPVVQRAHAAHNPAAVYRDLMTIDDYCAARMISTPMCLLDCDVPVDGSTALVVSAVEAVADLRAPVAVEAMGSVRDGPSSWADVDLATIGRADARAMWSRTDLRPGDVDVAQLYDGFTIEAAWWLEALGFCDRGDAASFVDRGERISLGGELPLNTWGGQLSGGRLHAGFGHTAEAVRQLRGEAAGRQVAGAEVAVVTNGGGIDGGAALLTRWR